MSTSILRTIYHPSYVACLHSVLPAASTDAFPQGRAALSPICAPDQPPELQAIYTRKSPFADRTRETALFDRWMGVRIGTELRKCESELTEDGDGEDELLKRLQVSTDQVERGSMFGYPISHELIRYSPLLG